MKYLWEDLKMIFEIIVTIIVIFFISLRLLGVLFLSNDTNNTNKEVVDYETNVQNTFNPNFNKNTQIVEKDNYIITEEDLQKYKEKNDYKPGKTNPFGN